MNAVTNIWVRRTFDLRVFYFHDDKEFPEKKTPRDDARVCKTVEHFAIFGNISVPVCAANRLAFEKQ